MFFQRQTLLALSAFELAATGYPTERQAADITEALGGRLSSDASIRTNTSSAARWSDYHAPEAQILVTVAEEQDVAETVSSRYPTEHICSSF